MAICGCGLPALCCQPAVACSFIYADLWGELSTHLAPQALFTQEFSCAHTSATSFPLSKQTGGGDTVPTFSGLRVCLQFTWEVGLPPPISCGVFLPPPLSEAFLLPIAGHVLLLLPATMFVYSSVGSGSSPLSCVVFLLLPLSQAFPLLVAGHTPPLLPSLARPNLFIYSSWRDSPLRPSSVLRAPHPLCYVSLLFLMLITQFLFFPQVGVGLSRGLC
jgi:hypothetical protein